MRAGNWIVVIAAAGLAAACSEKRDSSARSGDARANYRRVQRAYDGAPPVIPHAVVALGRQNCLDCHLEGMDLGEDGLAPRTPHPERVNCRQCHVEQLVAESFVRTSFVGLARPARGTRAYPGAPPTLPHPRNGRENCGGCHGENGGSPLRSPHADRVNCLQCHVEQHGDGAPYADNTFGGRP
jgi:cytochrome c-type protein NapB